MARKNGDKMIWLIGREIPKIITRRLPSNRKVLRLFFYKHLTENLTIRRNAHKTIEEVFEQWICANIPTRRLNSAISKLIRLHQTWKKLLKNRSKKDLPSQISKEREFKRNLDKLFNVAHHCAVKNVEDLERQFLLSQRRNIGNYPAQSAIPEESTNFLSPNSTGDENSKHNDFENDEVSAGND